MVVARPVGALDASMTVQVEIKLCGVADVPVNQSACTNTTFSLVKKLHRPVQFHKPTAVLKVVIQAKTTAHCISTHLKQTTVSVQVPEAFVVAYS